MRGVTTVAAWAAVVVAGLLAFSPGMGLPEVAAMAAVSVVASLFGIAHDIWGVR